MYIKTQKFLGLFFLCFLFFCCTKVTDESTNNIISNYQNYKLLDQTTIQLEKINLNIKFNNPWAIDFINDNELLISEKNGNLIYINLDKNQSHYINHQVPSIQHGQGGLLDIKKNKIFLYLTFSKKNSNNKLTTAIGRGQLLKPYTDLINFELLFESEPYYKDGVHFGSRLVIEDNYLYASIGERGQGSAAQDLMSHTGSIIRINLDGSIPVNPYNNQNSLKEIFMIGVRNPQGMALSPQGEIFITNHGAKGGDFLGKVKGGENYGWDKIGWGGTNYSGTKIGKGDSFSKIFKSPILSWVPSIAPSDLVFYSGEEFLDWNGDILITSLKYKFLLKLEIDNGEIIDKEIIFKDKIGRLRDVDINSKGEIFIITDEKKSSIWKLKSN